MFRDFGLRYAVGLVRPESRNNQAQMEGSASRLVLVICLAVRAGQVVARSAQSVWPP